MDSYPNLYLVRFAQCQEAFRLPETLAICKLFSICISEEDIGGYLLDVFYYYNNGINILTNI